MKEIYFNTSYKKILADVYTPVSIYLRLRDKFRDTILLESTDFHAGENSYSIIGINAVAGVEIVDQQIAEYKMPAEKPEKIELQQKDKLADVMQQFISRLKPKETPLAPVHIAQSLFGYTAYDAIPFFEQIKFSEKKAVNNASSVPLMRYRLYQYVIIVDHFKDELYICENHFAGLESRLADVESLIKGKDVPVFPFLIKGQEQTNITDEAYLQMVNNGIRSCMRGDIFQVVLSRRFEQGFSGDDFNVYRALRSVNPSPYLFYFDYGDYKLMGSSPEGQLIIEKGNATVHPIAGTFKRTGNDETDRQLAMELENDPKENAEHVMLVDLARNDLSRVCNNVEVTAYKKIQFYSHVIHMVSEVQGKIFESANPFSILGCTFPAGTLSGAPKYKAMQIIDEQEPTARGFYGGAIGFIGLDGSCNHAIMIRSILTRYNTLYYQAGAGIVAASKPENELQEVSNKLGALKKAIQLAQTI